MKNSKIMLLTAVLFTFLSLFSCSDSNIEPTDLKMEELQNLSGTYIDINPYAYGEAFGQRIFTFDDGNWTLKFTLGLDPELKMQVFEFRTHGSYKVVEESLIVEGAYNPEFGEDKKYVTLKTDNQQLIEAFGFAQCGLTPFVEKDVSIDGCSLWKPVVECPVDYDLLSLDQEGKLYFGQRPADNNMCSSELRPTALTPGTTKI